VGRRHKDGEGRGIWRRERGGAWREDRGGERVGESGRVRVKKIQHVGPISDSLSTSLPCGSTCKFTRNRG
jgi:hypothetical protein